MVLRALHDGRDKVSKRASEGFSAPVEAWDDREGRRRLVGNEVERRGRYVGKGRTLAELGSGRLTCGYKGPFH